MTLPSWAPHCGEGCTNVAHYYVWVTGEGGTESHLRLHREDIDLTVVHTRLSDACSDVLRNQRTDFRGIGAFELDEPSALIEFTFGDDDQVSCGHGPLGRKELMSVRELVQAGAAKLQKLDH